MSNNLEQAKQEFSNAGGKFNWKSTRDRLRQAEQQAIEDANSQYPQMNNPDAADKINRALGYLAVAFVGVFMVAGVGIMLVVTPLAEAANVFGGLMLIKANTAVAVLTVIALFVAYVVLSFMQHPLYDSIENSDNEKTKQSYEKTVTSLKWLKIVLLTLSFIGRMSSLIIEVGGVTLPELPLALANTLTLNHLLFSFASVGVMFVLLLATDTGVQFAYATFLRTAGRLDMSAKNYDLSDLQNKLTTQYQIEALNNMTYDLQTKSS